MQRPQLSVTRALLLFLISLRVCAVNSVYIAFPPGAAYESASYACPAGSSCCVSEDVSGSDDGVSALGWIVPTYTTSSRLI